MQFGSWAHGGNCVHVRCTGRSCNGATRFKNVKGRLGRDISAFSRRNSTHLSLTVAIIIYRISEYKDLPGCAACAFFFESAFVQYTAAYNDAVTLLTLPKVVGKWVIFRGGQCGVCEGNPLDCRLSAQCSGRSPGNVNLYGHMGGKS